MSVNDFTIEDYRGAAPFWVTYRWVAIFPDRERGWQHCWNYHGKTYRSRPHTSRETAERCAAEIITGKRKHRSER